MKSIRKIKLIYENCKVEILCLCSNHLKELGEKSLKDGKWFDKIEVLEKYEPF